MVSKRSASPATTNSSRSTRTKDESAVPSSVSTPLSPTVITKTIATKPTESSNSSSSLALPDRNIDYWFLVWYGIFWFTVMWTDLHNFIASTTGVTVQDLEHRVMDKGESLTIPPYFLSYYYFRWARTSDPLLYQNPVWWQCIEWVNLLCLMPFAAVAGYAFYKGYNWIRTPAIIVSSFTFYSLIMCIGTSLFHEYDSGRTRQPLIFFFIYVPYLIFPALVVARVWNDNPFSKPLDAQRDMIIKVIASVTYFTFIAAGIAWYFTCEVNDAAKASCTVTTTLNDASITPYVTVSDNLKFYSRLIGTFIYGAAIAFIGNFIVKQH